MTWEIVWPDHVRHSGDTPIDILQQVRGEQFSPYSTLDEFVIELLRRAAIWSGSQISPDQDYAEILKHMADANVITLYIEGERHA